MDQLKQQLAIVLKYGFWIGSSIVLLGSLLTWYLSTSNLAEENRSQTSKLDGAVASVTSVRSELDTQPNDLSHTAMEELIEARKNEVLASWKKLYEKQQSLLTWPTEELTSDLTDRFEGLIPIERYVESPTAEADEIPPYLRKQYQTYIGNVLPDIASIAEAEWSASLDRSASMQMGGASAYGGRLGPTVDITGSEAGPLVKWSSGSQQSLLEDLFPWRGKGTPPSTLEVYYSQENLWILKQMLQIIANVNGDAQQPYQAKIHEIARISIGKKVSFTAGTISKPGEGMSAGGMGGMDYMDMEGMDDYGDGDMYGGDAAYGGGATVVAVDPADSRYVNAQNEPVTGAALRTALTSNSPADAEIAVAKRVPVMMALQIDQRYIQQLLAECGSAPLMIQVKQVRILPKEGLQSIGGGMGGGMEDMMEDDMDMDMGMDEMDMGMGMGMGMGMVAAPPKEPAEEFPLDMAIELYGLIYMYNPPDPVKLGVEEIDKDSVIEGVTEPKQGEPVAPVPPAEVNDVLPTPPDTQPPPPTGEPAPSAPPADAADPSGQPPADAAAPPVAETGTTTTPPPAIVLPLP